MEIAWKYLVIFLGGYFIKGLLNGFNPCWDNVTQARKTISYFLNLAFA